MNILLVEDSQFEGQAVQKTLEREKIDSSQLAWAHTLTEALAHLTSHPVDIVLLDLNLPDAQGIDTVSRIRQTAPAVPIIVLTASDDDLLAKEALQEGAQDYIPKGYLRVYRNLLGRAMRYAIERNRMLIERRQAAERERERAAELDKAYRELKQTQAMLVQAEKMAAVGQLASGIAHEVKNPLSIILQGVTYLEQELGRTNGQQAEVIDMIKDAVKRSDKIVRGLLEFSRPTQLEAKPAQVDRVLEASLALAEKQLSVKNIRIVKEIAPSLPLVKIDENYMKQVFINLIVNAFQAMPDGGTLTIRAGTRQLTEIGRRVGRRQSDQFALGETAMVCDVVDTGIGISEEVLSKIFDPFFTTKPPGEGVGLGLPITRTIVEAHGGVVVANSQEGRGTAMRVILPIYDGLEAAAAGPRPAVDQAPHQEARHAA